jgi:hypothetical protein
LKLVDFGLVGLQHLRPSYTLVVCFFFNAYLKPTSSTLNQLNTKNKMMNLDFINGNGAKNHMLKEGINFGFHHEF